MPPPGPPTPQEAPARAAAGGGPSAAEAEAATLREGWEQEHIAAMDGWLAACGTPGEAAARRRLEGCLAGLAPAAAVRAFERLLRAAIAWRVLGRKCCASNMLVLLSALPCHAMRFPLHVQVAAGGGGRRIGSHPLCAARPGQRQHAGWRAAEWQPRCCLLGAVRGARSSAGGGVVGAGQQRHLQRLVGQMDKGGLCLHMPPSHTVCASSAAVMAEQLLASPAFQVILGLASASLAEVEVGAGVARGQPAWPGGSLPWQPQGCG